MKGTAFTERANAFAIAKYHAYAILGEPRLRANVDYVSFTGDFGFSGRLPKKSDVERYLQQESSLLAYFGLCAINLEYMLPGFSGKAIDREIDAVTLNTLNQAGYRLVARANNHAADHGAVGMAYGTNELAAAGLSQVGTRDFPVYRWRPRGMTVAIFSLTDTTDRIDETGAILKINPADLALIDENAQGCEFRIAFVHLGSMSSFPSSHERKQARRLVAAGADLIVSTGSHFIKGFAWEKGKPIAYGIGNHMFSFVDEATEPIGMHLVAGLLGGTLVQLFAVPFYNTIFAGHTGPLSEMDFISFVKMFVERSDGRRGKYFSDRRSLDCLEGYLRDFSYSKLKQIRPRHLAYGIAVLFCHYRGFVIAATLISIPVVVLLLRWIWLQ